MPTRAIRGENFVFYNPPSSIARSASAAVTSMNPRGGAEFLNRDLQTMVFANSRLHTEVLLTICSRPIRNFRKTGNIRGYRGGYLPNERREIERGLRDGKFAESFPPARSSSAIDVGSLDTVVMAGYAGTIAATCSAPDAPDAAAEALRRAGGVLRASRSINRAHPDYFFRQHARARFHPARNLEILITT